MANLGWVPLPERRAQAKVKIIFKAKNDMLHIPLNHLMLNRTSTRKSENCYKIPRSNTNVHLFSFYPDTIRLWNKLPTQLKNATTVESFTKGLEGFYLRCETNSY